MICIRCQSNYRLDKDDSLCGRCRSRKSYLSNVDKYRKIKTCVCGKKILKTSQYCNRCSQLHELNHQWKDKKTDRTIYRRPEYRQWRIEVFKKYGKKCLLCEGTYRLAAHHILPKREYPELQFNVSNGVPLCHKCHSKMQYKEHEFFHLIMAELKLCELGERCDADTELSYFIKYKIESVTTRDEINFPTSAGQPLNI